MNQSFAVGHCQREGFVAISLARKCHIVCTAFDGSMVVACGQVAADLRAVMVVTFNEYCRFQRFACNRVGDGAVNSEKALLHVTQHTLVVKSPVHRHLRRVGRV